MSTLSVTTVTTANGTTDHTINTGNSSAGDIILYANGVGLQLNGNSSVNNVTIFSNGQFIIANSTANTFTVNSSGGVAFSSAITSGGLTTIANTVFNSTGTSIEVNNNGTGDRNAIIDFHSDDTYTDYSFRVFASAGNNAARSIITRGTGNFQLQTTEAANIVFTTNNATVGTMTSTGDFFWQNTITFGVNNKALRFATVNTSSYATMIQQNDDNFVFYSTNTAYGQRAIWSVFANSITSALTISVNTTISTNTLTLGTSTAAANGYTFLPNGLKMVWGLVAAANTAAGTTATYASAFTTATYVVQVSHQGNARTVPALVVSSNTTAANISSGLAATSGTNVYFTAIGI
jgi:hypothetical protein